MNKLALAIAVVMFFFFGKNVLDSQADYISADKEYNEVMEAAEAASTEVSSQIVSEDNGAEIVNPECEALRSMNDDFVATLSVEELGIELPVVQGTDNEHYLHYTFEGNENKNGCLFLDCDDDASFAKGATIYGHNMKNGSMFGSLKKLLSDGFDKNNVKASVKTATKTFEYKLANVEVVDIASYEAAEAEGTLTLYTCYGKDHSKRLLVTFEQV